MKLNLDNFTDRAIKVLELAYKAALEMGDDYINTEHLLIGIVREYDGVAACALRDLGCRGEHVEKAINELMAGK